MSEYQGTYGAWQIETVDCDLLRPLENETARAGRFISGPMRGQYCIYSTADGHVYDADLWVERRCNQHWRRGPVRLEKTWASKNLTVYLVIAVGSVQQLLDRAERLGPTESQRPDYVRVEDCWHG